jgi:hypothetical protein
MILVGFFLWKAVGDIFNLEYKSLVPFGYNEEGVYRVELGEYGKDNNMYNADADNDNARTDNIKRIISTLRQSGEMTDFFVLEGGIAVPNSDNFDRHFDNEGHHRLSSSALHKIYFQWF